MSAQPSKMEQEVSVVITNYNYAEYLQQAIESVLNQTHSNIKLIIFDDASTDDSAVILDNYKDKATIIKHKKNKGIVSTRNEALDLVKSPFLLFLDADDWLNDEYIEKLLSAAIEDSLDVAYCGMQHYINGKKDWLWKSGEFNLDRLKNENFIQMSSLIRTDAVKDVRFDKEMDELTHEDWDFFLTMALRGAKIQLVKNIYLNYRLKDGSRNLVEKSADVKFANLYRHMYEKYVDDYPEEIAHLAYYRFVKSFIIANDKLNEAEKRLASHFNRVSELESQISSIRKSRSYKIARMVAFPIRISKKIINKALGFNIRTFVYKSITHTRAYRWIDDQIFSYRNRKSKSESYFIRKEGSFEKSSQNAVVLHLYFLESWYKIFAERLEEFFRHTNVDLYITMPESNAGFIDEIKKTFSNVNILIVPNRGRDVLPFLKTASLLRDMGYQKVLKVHSKKSLHRRVEVKRESGDAWLEKMLDSLIPRDEKVLNNLLSYIDHKDTGIIGPRKYYYPLKTYLRNNINSLRKIMRDSYPDFLKGYVAPKIDSLGFFGGTMFWIDLEAIAPALTVSKDNFPRERGQYDGTTAHALERVFGVLPQLKGKKVYGADPNGIKEMNIGDEKYPEHYREDVSCGRPGISVVVPVYGDWYSLSKNIKSLKRYYANTNGLSVHYVNDCGPEADLLESKILTAISGLTNFYYHRNSRNTGFIKTCNRAVFELVSKDDDILLLNSDTKVTRNFIEEMRDVLYSEWNIGAVTSRSNNATIWSVPMTQSMSQHRAVSYVLYRIIKPSLPSSYITPTVHGFCVLIRRQVISEYGLFDEVYGKGYGEENDFAMRIQTHGWKCAVANYSYVFHYESRSFGSEARNSQIEHNEKILLERYPDYRMRVQEYWDSIKEPLK